MQGKRVRDFIIDHFLFPHIPYWFSLKEAIIVMREALSNATSCFRPIVMLVFDEKYNLVGTLTHVDILRGLEPTYLKPVQKVEGHKEPELSLAVIDDLLFRDCKRMAEKPVSSAMSPVKHFVTSDDPITKAAYIMLHENQIILPVLENRRLIGVVRLIEIFDEIAKSVIE